MMRRPTRLLILSTWTLLLSASMLYAQDPVEQELPIIQNMSEQDSLALFKDLKEAAKEAEKAEKTAAKEAAKAEKAAAKEAAKAGPYFKAKQHMIGVKGAGALTTIHFNPNRQQSFTPSYVNASILYTYYHDMWGTMKLFGVQTGLTYCQTGYAINYSLAEDGSKRYRRVMYDVVQVPLVCQFHMDFWHMRLLLNLGTFVGYRLKATNYTHTEPLGTPVVFDCNDYWADYGLQGGVGLAYCFKPFELHLEGNYQYSLSMIENPGRNSNENFSYGYPNQIIISIGLHIHL